MKLGREPKADLEYSREDAKLYGYKHAWGLRHKGAFQHPPHSFHFIKHTLSIFCMQCPEEGTITLRPDVSLGKVNLG